MQHYLRGHGLLKFVDGSYPCPPQFQSADNTGADEKWLEQDSSVISLITTTLSADALTLVITMGQAPYIMHGTPSIIECVSNTSQQAVNGATSYTSDLMAQYNNGNVAHPQYSNGSFTQQVGATSHNGMSMTPNNLGSISQGPLSQHNLVQSQSTGIFSGNFNSNEGNNGSYSDDTIQNNYPQLPSSSNNSRNSVNNSKPKFSTNQV
ncbi:hypothetical protein ABKV19_002803 [Rosa sericea]